MKSFQKGPGIELNLINLSLLTMFALVIFQGVGLLLEKPLGITFTLGPVFILIPLAIASIMGLIILKKAYHKEQITKQDVFAVVITMAIALIIMFTLPSIIPEIFSPDLRLIQSMVGLA